MSLETLHCAAVAAAAIKIEHKKKRYQEHWIASFLEKGNQNVNLLGEVRMDSCALFRNFTRMTASKSELLLQLIRPSIKKQDTNMREAIPKSMRLAVTLQFLATGDLYHSLMYIFRISVPAILTIIPEVCQAVIKSLKGYVEVSKKSFIDMMPTLTKAHKCMEVYYTQYNIITYIHVAHIYRFHLSAMNSEIPFALDGLVAII
jgi:hypothetical protein